jgi:hypothetical protein
MRRDRTNLGPSVVRGKGPCPRDSTVREPRNPNITELERLASTTRSRLTSGQQDGGRCVGGPDGSGIPFGTTTTPVDIV